ncbi:MAG: hypothetical protein RR734_02575 [Bacilli bacterium]
MKKSKLFVLALASFVVVGTTGGLVACGETPSTVPPTTITDVDAQKIEIIKQPGQQLVGAVLKLSEYVNVEPLNAKLTIISSQAKVVEVDGTNLKCIGEGTSTINVKSGKKEVNLDVIVLTASKAAVLNALDLIKDNYTLLDIKDPKAISPAVVLNKDYIYDGWFGAYSAVKLSDKRLHKFRFTKKGELVVSPNYASADGFAIFNNISGDFFKPQAFTERADGYIESTDRTQIDGFVNDCLNTISDSYNKIAFKSAIDPETNEQILFLQIYGIDSETQVDGLLMDLAYCDLGTSSIAELDTFIASGVIPADNANYTPLTKAFNNAKIITDINYTVRAVRQLEMKKADGSYDSPIDEVDITHTLEKTKAMRKLSIYDFETNKVETTYSGVEEKGGKVFQTTSVDGTSVLFGPEVAKATNISQVLYTIGNSMSDGAQNLYLSKLGIDTFFDIEHFEEFTNKDGVVLGLMYSGSLDNGLFSYILCSTLGLAYFGDYNKESAGTYAAHDYYFTFAENGDVSIETEPLRFSNAREKLTFTISKVGATTVTAATDPVVPPAGA